MVHKLNEVSEHIPDLSDGSTIFDGKLWTVKSGTTFVSDDWGDTFTSAENNLPVLSGDHYVHFSKVGTMFVCRSRLLYRAVYPYTEFTQVLGLHTTASIVRDWSFTEDNDGVIYVTEYANYPDPEGGVMNVIYWYKSLDDGITWVKHDNLHHVDDKHLHQLKVDPFSNTLYATTGDGKKLVYKSTNKGESWEEVIPTNYPLKDERNINYGGHTGTGFFDTGEILWGTDWQPKDPVTGTNWNWFVRSNGDDPDSFVYDKMQKKYYGMCGGIITDYHSGEAWTSLRDEFAEDDVHPVLMYTKNKGVSWEPLVELPATGDLNAGGLISYADNTVKDSPYIFWGVRNYGVVRISRYLKPEMPEIPEIPEVKPSNVINEVEFFINQNNKIYEVELFNREGSIKYNSPFVGN